MTQPTRSPLDLSEVELRRRFAVRVERFDHPRLALELLLPTSADGLIDPSSFELDERLPYWAELWPSARALARHLLEAENTPHVRSIELGCGLGLPSLALAEGGHRVLATDYYQDALAFAAVNAKRNNVSGLELALLDWRAAQDLGTFDLVIAADVLYEKRNAVNLAALIPTLVRPGGSVLIADPGRLYLADFRSAVEHQGWTLRLMDERSETSDPTTRAVSRVAIYSLER